MSNIKTKELIICLIAIIALVLTITTNVFATTPNIDVLNQDINNAQNIQEKNATDNTPKPATTTNNNNTNGNNTNNNNTNNTTKSIPYTGIDYSVILIIAICGISAVYAYKKIRDYNV